MAGPAGQRRSESAPPGRVATAPGLGCQDTSTTLLGRGAGEATRAGTPSVQGLGLSAPPRAGGCPRPSPQPGAVRPQPRRGGCSCARERGLPPRQLRRAPGSREDHLFPAPLAPRSVQPGCASPAAAGVLAAAAPDGPLPPQTEPPRRAAPRRAEPAPRKRALRPDASAAGAAARLSPGPRPRPASRRPRPPATPPARPSGPVRRGAAPGQWPGVWAGSAGPKRGWGEDTGLQATPPPPRPAPRTLPQSRQHQWSSCAGLARVGVQSGARSLAASEGSPLGRSRPLVSAQRSLDWERPRPPSRPRPRCSGCWSPGGGRRPSWSGGLWPSFGHLSHLSVPVQDWQGAGGLPGGPQSVRGSRGGAAVARGGQSQATELWLRLGRPKAVVCTGPPQTTAQPSLPTAPGLAGAPGWGRGRR